MTWWNGVVDEAPRVGSFLGPVGLAGTGTCGISAYAKNPKGAPPPLINKRNFDGLFWVVD
jgi:hypothetical protein